MSNGKGVLRWGGLAGMPGGIVFILVPVTLFGFGRRRLPIRQDWS